MIVSCIASQPFHDTNIQLLLQLSLPVQRNNGGAISLLHIRAKTAELVSISVCLYSTSTDNSNDALVHLDICEPPLPGTLPRVSLAYPANSAVSRRGIILPMQRPLPVERNGARLACKSEELVTN